MDVTQLTYELFDGHDINSSNYAPLKFPAGSPILAKSTPETSERADNFPTDDGARLRGRDFPLRIRIIGSGTLAELESWFDTSDTSEPKVLKANDGSVDWYIYARPTDLYLQGPPGKQWVFINLYAADPIWKKFSPSTDAWTITASGQTNDVTPIGNKFAKPVFVIEPTSARSGGFAFKRFVAIANRTTRIYKDAINLIDGNWNTAALVADTSVSNQLNGGINDSVTTIDIDTAVGGGLPAAGMGYVDTEQISWTANSGTQLTGVTRGINGTSAASHLDNAVIALSRLQADGDDVRVWNDETATEEYRWFGGGGFNSTTTFVWSNVVMPPKLEGTVSGAISNVGAVSSITLKSTPANKAMLTELAKVSYKFVAVDMGTAEFEIFKFTSVSPSTYKINGVTRAQKGTSNQSHIDGDTVRHIHGYYLFYGNSSTAAPTTDDSFKPIINLATSTNTSHVYASFYDLLNPNRTCQWTPQVLKNVGLLSEYYTATQDTFADEASVIGGAIKVYLVGTAVRSPSARIAWYLYHPAGMTTLTWTGNKYRASTGWPAKMQMQKSNTGKDTEFAVVATEATPASPSSWGALSSHSSVSLVSTYLYIRLMADGTINNVADNLAAVEVTDLTATLDSANVPLINAAAAVANNYMEFRITNTVNAVDQWWFEVSQQVPVNDSITIDTNNLEAYAEDGSPVSVRLDDESRQEWAPLTPGVTNTLTYTEVGVIGVSVATSWEDRNL